MLRLMFHLISVCNVSLNISNLKLELFLNGSTIFFILVLYYLVGSNCTMFHLMCHRVCVILHLCHQGCSLSTLECLFFSSHLS